MEVLNVIQRSEGWKAIRQNYDTASEASAALGKSKYVSRSELLKQKASGVEKDIDAQKQSLFNRGHDAEAASRPYAEKIAAADLYPITAVAEIEGLKLLASLDGATLECDVIFEHKLWSEPLAADVVAGALAEHYTIQMDQQMLVTGAKKCLFMVSDGTEEKMVWCWYESSQKKFDALIAGWKQFKKDLADYVPAEVVPVAIGRTPETLPALRIEVTGMVTASNLTAFRDHALAVFADINRTLTTDQEFATAKATVKWCGDVETRLAAAKQHALSQTESIDALFRTIDDISAESKKVRLELDKLVTRREGEVKDGIVTTARAAYEQHVRQLKEETGGSWIVLSAPDFAAAIKGKRSLVLMQDAVDTALANAKIAADTSARNIRANLACIKEDGAGFDFLFNDRLMLIGKPMDDLKLLIKSRIAEHTAAEAAKEEALRARIAEEERTKAEAKAKTDADRILKEKQDAFDAQMREQAATAQQEAKPINSAGQHYSQTTLRDDGAPILLNADGTRSVFCDIDVGEKRLNAASPTLKLGEICARIAPLSIGADGLRQLGFEPAGRERSAVLYHESDWTAMRNAMAGHIGREHQKQAA